MPLLVLSLLFAFNGGVFLFSARLLHTANALYTKVARVRVVEPRVCATIASGSRAIATFWMVLSFTALFSASAALPESLKPLRRRPTCLDPTGAASGIDEAAQLDATVADLKRKLDVLVFMQTFKRGPNLSPSPKLKAFIAGCNGTVHGGGRAH